MTSNTRSTNNLLRYKARLPKHRAFCADDVVHSMSLTYEGAVITLGRFHKRGQLTLAYKQPGRKQGRGTQFYLWSEE
jgi:hypothetical protein